MLWHALASFLLPLVPLLAVFGNGLVMIAVYQERSLQTVTNLLIVSLAVSDLLVAIFVMSFGIYFQINNFEWGLGTLMCNVYLASDVMCSTASILNLLAISLDRYMAISHPLAYAQHGSRGGRAMLSISIVWGVSIAVGLPILFGVNPPDNENACEFANPYFNIVSSLLSFFLPCTAMFVLYAVIFKRLRQRERARSERKANKADKERISSALLGGARIASQMGRHFKNRTDQILLEISFQTSSFPTCSDSSEENTTSSLNGVVRLSPPVQIPSVPVVPIPSPAVSPIEELPRDPSPQPSTPPAKEDEPSKEDSPDTYRSFGEHLQENFPFIDSGSRRSSIEEKHERKYHESSRRRRTERTRLVAQSATTTPLRVAKMNGTVVREESSSQPEVRVKDTVKACVSQPHPLTVDVPKIHRTVTTAPSSREDLASKEKMASQFIDQFKPHELDCSLGDSVKLYRKQLWKRVTSGWKTRPSRQLVKKATKQMRREHKATVTLAVVLAVFLAFWLPFFTLHFTNSWCVLLTDDTCVHNLLLSITTWLGYINSSLNPLIYTVFDQRFRNAFHGIICCSRRRR